MFSMLDVRDTRKQGVNKSNRLTVQKKQTTTRS